MSKVAPKISAPGSMKLATGTRNTDVGKHASGQALAKVKPAKGAPSAGSFLPVSKPKAGLASQSVGQPNPQTGAAASAKPKRRGIGAAFYGEY